MFRKGYMDQKTNLELGTLYFENLVPWFMTLKRVIRAEDVFQG